MYFNGSNWTNASLVSKGGVNLGSLGVHTLTFDHRNRTLCYVIEQSQIQCAAIGQLDKPWNLSLPALYPKEGTIEEKLG